MSDSDLEAAVAAANLPTLLLVLAQLTGDLRWLDDPYRPTRIQGVDENDDGGLAPETQAEVCQAAVEAISRWQSGEPIALPDPSDELLCRMLSFSTGEEVPSEYGPWIAAELRHAEAPRGAPHPRRAGTEEDPSVLIVGAGASGLAAAASLDELGIRWTVVEKADSVGGTWKHNRYPGCGVDTPSHLYSFSSFPFDWAYYFELQPVLIEYFEAFAREHDLHRGIRFETEVTGARYDEATQGWDVELRTAAGDIETVHADVLITAVGSFGRPVVPDVSGLENFSGVVCHTADWPDDLSYAGKRVAVVGNGASAMQLVPAISEDASSVVVLQRTAHWVAPFPKFRVEVPDAVRRLFSSVPLYRVWYRVRLAWIWTDRLHSSLQIDPSWPHPDRSIGPVNDAHRRHFTRYAEAELGDRDDLLEQVIPSYPPYGKRILLDNGWFRTLRRPNVTLNSSGLQSVNESSVLAGDGTEHEVDVIVFATGFDVIRYLAPMAIVGRSGVALRDAWDDDDARAYLGLAVPDFPNLFVLYGPNTQPGAGGSIVGTVESQVGYVMRLLQMMRERGLGTIECKPEVYDEYAARVDAAHEKMVWTHPGMSTYYRNSRGRVVVNSPWRNVDFWSLTREPDLDDYRIELSHRADAPAPA